MTGRTRPLARALTPVLAVWLLLALIATVEAQLAGPRFRVGSSFPARVTTVVDGDTIHVVDGGGRTIVVRLEGIDTPERGEPFSTQARNAARVLLFDKTATLKAADVDRYGRLVARVYVDGSDTSVALVRSGLACHFTRYSTDPLLAQAQQQAQRSGAGFWAPGAARPSCATTSRPKNGAAAGPFRGNTGSRLFHAPGCPNYQCRNCTAVFESREQATAGGFKPAADCLH